MAIYEYEGFTPEVGEGSYVHPEAVLIGAVRIGKGCFIGAGAALRGDFGQILVGDGSNVQENVVLHASPWQPVDIGANVVVGHGSLMHDAVVKTGATVGMGAILLHNVVVEEEAYVAAGAVVAPGFTVPSRKIVMGNPARVLKDVSDKMMEMNRMGLAAYQALPARYKATCRRVESGKGEWRD